MGCCVGGAFAIRQMRVRFAAELTGLTPRRMLEGFLAVAGKTRCPSPEKCIVDNCLQVFLVAN